MDIDSVLAGLDELYAKNRTDRVEGYLGEKLVEAMKEEDSAAVLSLLNEMVGFCRDTDQHEKSVLFGQKALSLIESEGLAGSVAHGTTLLNYANALRAAGRSEESIEAYRQTDEIYKSSREERDFSFAPLYNNLSLVYMETGEHGKAAEYLEKALAIVTEKAEEANRIGGSRSESPGIEETGREYGFELAVTHTNLGNCLVQLGRDKEALEHLHTALKLYEARRLFDTHYAAAVMGEGELSERQGKLQEALYSYIRGMEAIRNNYGFTDFYFRVKDRYDRCLEALEAAGVPFSNPLTMKGMDICREYYRQVVLPEFERKYPDLCKRAAIGLKGAGSECLGFDDVISRDHDWGPGVCIWLRHDDLEGREDELRRWYDSLNPDFMGFKRMESVAARDYERGNRVGILDFDDNILSVINNSKAPGESRESREAALSLVTGGEIFYDPSGMFADVPDSRKYLGGNKERKSACAYYARLFSQRLQYNFRRMAVRGDMLTAEMFLADGYKSALHLAHAISGVYAPFEKWLHASAKDLEYGEKTGEYIAEIRELVRGLSDKDITEQALRPVLGAIDELAGYLRDEMVRAGLLDGNFAKTAGDYLEDIAVRLESVTHQKS